MKPPRAARPLPTDLRSLTPIELRCMQSRLRGQRLGRWITLAMLLLLCGGMLGLLSLPVEARVTVVIVGILALGIASFFFLMGMCGACDAAERRWAPLIDTRDHSERLSKTAEGSCSHLMRHRKRAPT